MSNLQLLLTGDKGFSDISIHGSSTDDSISFMLGLALVEKFRRDPKSLQYKMAIGRLVNLGYSLREIERSFGHDRRTALSWASGLKTLDPEVFLRIYSGQGSLHKIDDVIECFIRTRYRELYGTIRQYREQIRLEVMARFKKHICGEILRRIFRLEDAEVARAAEERGAISALPAPCDVPASSAVGSDPAIRSLTAPPYEEPTAAVPATPTDREPESLPAPVPPTVLSFPELAGTGAAIRGVAEPPPVPTTPAASESDGLGPAAQEPSCEESATSRTILPSSRNHSPALDMLPLSGGLPYGRPILCHHAGAILFAPWMETVDRGRPETWQIQRQWLGQILQGAVNLEQSKTITGEDLARFTGAPDTVIQTQREKLAAEAQNDTVAEWLLDANRRIVPDGPGTGHCYYYDPHSKEYMGELPFLKGWCGRIHGIAKVMHLDFIHTASGYPVYLRHYDNYDDLRTRVFMPLAGFDLLFPKEMRRGRVLVIDRGIFDQDIFQLLTDQGYGLVTWEKGYRSGAWREDIPSEKLTITRLGNNSNDKRFYRFVIQETPWVKAPGVRRLIVRATNPKGRMVEVSVLCSCPTLDLKEAVRLIFCRWLQENDFKMLDKHFGMMEITSYQSKTYKEIAETLINRSVESREFRELKARGRELTRLLERDLYNREKIQDLLKRNESEIADGKRELPQLETRLNGDMGMSVTTRSIDMGLLAKVGKLATRVLELTKSLLKAQKGRPKLLARLEALQKSIADKKEELAKHEDRLKTVVREDSRVRMLVEAGSVRPDTRAKAILDALKMTARNIFAGLLLEFRKSYDNRRDDAVILRLLTRATGCLRMKGQTLEVAL